MIMRLLLIQSDALRFHHLSFNPYLSSHPSMPPGPQTSDYPSLPDQVPAPGLPAAQTATRPARRACGRACQAGNAEVYREGICALRSVRAKEDGREREEGLGCEDETDLR